MRVAAARGERRVLLLAAQAKSAPVSRSACSNRDLPEPVDKHVKRRLNQISGRYAAIGLVVSLTLVLLQEHLLENSVFSEGAVVIGVMTVVVGYAARASYKAGREDGLEEKSMTKAEV